MKIKPNLNVWLFLLALVILTIALPGVDLYTHLHFSWLYNQMFRHFSPMVYDFSTLNGHQFIYTVGPVSYILSGLLWFIFGKWSVMLLEIAGLGVLFFTSQKVLGKMLAIAWLVPVYLFMMLSHMYPYFLSVVLFFLGLYLMKIKKDRLGEISVLLAGLNHPYISATNLVFLFSKRKFLKIGIVVVLLVQVLIFGRKFYSGIGYEKVPLALTLWTIPALLIRTTVLFSPFVAKVFLPKVVNALKFWHVWAALLIFTIPMYHVNYTTDLSFGYKISCYYGDKYSDVGKLDGNVRVVDICRNGLYSLPMQGNILTVSPYFEGQDYYTYWESPEQYRTFLNRTNASYVIHCKNCTWETTKLKQANELEMLQRNNFTVYNETAEYYIFKTK